MATPYIRTALLETETAMDSSATARFHKKANRGGGCNFRMVISVFIFLPFGIFMRCDVTDVMCVRSFVVFANRNILSHLFFFFLRVNTTPLLRGGTNVPFLLLVTQHLSDTTIHTHATLLILKCTFFYAFTTHPIIHIQYIRTWMCC